MGLEVGYAWIFENIVIYGSSQSLINMLNQRKARKYGEFLGVVKGEIPQEKFCVLYEWLTVPKAVKMRKMERSVLKRLGLSRRKMRFMKLNGQQTLRVKYINGYL